MRFLSAFLGLWLSATAALANPDVDRLVDAMGMPALIRAFASEGMASSDNLNTAFLNGQGGAVWAETVRKLYDPDRIEAELRSGLAETLDPEVARTALVFFDSPLGQRIIALEVQGREAMIDSDIEEMAKAAGADAGAEVTEFVALRNLVARNTDAAIGAQVAFFAGMAETAITPFPAPDVDGQRPMIQSETKAWLTGYYALVLSALKADDIQTYTDFWRTSVGSAVDDAVFEAFGDTYAGLSYALGQAVGHLVPPNEL